MDQYIESINQAVEYIKSKLPDDFSPQVTLTLGSGLGKIANLIDQVASIAYKDIPKFPITTAPGHEGTLIFGYFSGVPIMGLKGRKHFFEVARERNGMDQVIFPVHVAASLGSKWYIASNAAGGLNLDFEVGDMMIIKSHISVFTQNPLLGPHHDFGGNAFFQPMSEIYDAQLRSQLMTSIPDLKEGVYTCLTGRTYETQAECQMLRTLGSDAVGMSTVPEIIIAANRGMKTFGLSIITNIIAADGTNATNHEEVMSILNSPATENKISHTFMTLFQQIKSTL